MSAVVSVRIPAGLRKEMEKLKDVDWPELPKTVIEERVNREKLRLVWKDVEKLRSQIPPSPDPEFSTRSLKQDRGR